MIVGIDFGTSNSHVSVIIRKDPDDDLVKVNSNSDIPTLYLNVNGKEYYGSECDSYENEKFRSQVVREMKRVFRKNPHNINMTYGSGENTETLLEIINKYILYLIKLTKSCVNEYSPGEEIEYITVTSPSSLVNGGTPATEYNKTLKKTVADATGLNEKCIFIKEEPVAAAYSYLYDHKPTDDSTIFVFDLGGGTLDASIVRYYTKRNKSEVIVTKGAEVGGNDWNSRLMTLIQNEAFKLGLDPNKVTEEKHGKRIEELKIRLSDLEESSVFIDDENTEVEIPVSRGQFEIVTRDLLDKCSELVDNVFEKADYATKGDIQSFEDIDQLVLVGGGSNMPQVYDMFSKYPGLSGRISLYKPSVAISRGASLLAKMNGKETGSVKLGNRLNEKSQHSYGIKVECSDYPAGTVIKNIIFKGEEFVGGRVFRDLDRTVRPGSKDYTNAVELEIYESDCLKDECDNGAVDLDYDDVSFVTSYSIPIPDGYKANPMKYELKVSMSLDADGRLTVQGRNPEDQNLEFEYCYIKDDED